MQTSSVTSLDDERHDPRCFVRPELVPETVATNERGASSIALTRREREIALLLIDQLSNRDIASKLAISERTVEHHVQSVLGQLHLRSRFQVTADLIAVTSFSTKTRRT
ncbi:MAG: hypothetical protein JWN27_1885 [Candidatus Eremiobacteraeota bacterium]|nr:hypothetical protein [Candidatus Eremiobacteraeota bacterium]